MPNLPRATDEKLLIAIPRLKPWFADSKKKLWALREAGKQILVYGDRGAELDLSVESGTFRLNVVDLRTGEVRHGDQVVPGGAKMILPGGVVWLTRE